MPEQLMHVDDRSSGVACPICRASMVRRRNRRDRSEFWGCPNYSRCRGTRPIEAIDAARADEASPPRPISTPRNDPSWRRAEAGASARATYERRLERRRTRVRERRPQILLVGGALIVIGLVLVAMPNTWSFVGWPLVLLGIVRTLALLFIEPPNVRAWDIGAGGEERLGALLESLDGDGFAVLHDLRMRPSRENIDHLLIGPPGIFVIETKTYEGSVRVRGGDLYIKGRRKTGFFDQVDRQLAAVESALEAPGVRGFICILGGDFPWFGRPSARGIEVTPPKRLIETVRSLPTALDAPEIDRLARLAAERLR